MEGTQVRRRVEADQAIPIGKANLTINEQRVRKRAVPEVIAELGQE